MKEFDDNKQAKTEYTPGTEGKTPVSTLPCPNKFFSVFTKILKVLFIFIVAFVILYPIYINLTRARQPGALRSCQSNCKSIGTSLDMYAEDNKGRYPSKLNELIPSYIYKIPTCVKTDKDIYSLTYTVSTNPDAYTFWCTCGGDKSNVEGNYPQYSSEKGLVIK
jgi:hypothetical protein